MNKVAALPIYGKNPLKILFSRTMSDYHETWLTAKGTWVLQKLYKWWPWFDLDLFYNKVIFVHFGFYIGKVRPHFQISPKKPLDKLKADFMWNIYASQEQSLYNWSWPHDQDGCHAHIW